MRVTYDCELNVPKCFRTGHIDDSNYWWHLISDPALYSLYAGVPQLVMQFTLPS